MCHSLNIFKQHFMRLDILIIYICYLTIVHIGQESDRSFMGENSRCWKGSVSFFGGFKGESVFLPFSASRVHHFPWHVALSFILQSVLSIVQDVVTLIVLGQPIHPETDF